MGWEDIKSKLPFVGGKTTGGVTDVGQTNNAGGNTTTVKPELSQPDSTKIGGLASTAQAQQSDPLGLVKKLAAGDVGFETTDYLKPTSTTATTVEWKFGGGYEGRKMPAKTQIMLALPPEFQGRPVYMAVISHKQIQSDKSSVPEDKGGGKKWDNTPAHSALHFHSVDHQGKDAWRYWHAPWGASGQDGGKYAEVRGDWERETEFEFLKNGHSAVGGGWGRSNDALKIDAARLRSVGTDPTRVEKVVITFLPEYPDKTSQVIFSPGTNLGDPHTAAGRTYGKDYGKGTYPGALTLGGWGSTSADIQSKLGEGWAVENGALTFKLKAGQKFTGMEVACGDTHPDGKSNSDGETGTQGWAKLAIGIQHANGKIDWCAQDMTVPPQGVLFGGPALQNFVAQEGDKVVIRGSEDTVYVMGARAWFKEDK